MQLDFIQKVIKKKNKLSMGQPLKIQLFLQKFKPNIIQLGILVFREILSQSFFLIASQLPLPKIEVIFLGDQASNASHGTKVYHNFFAKYLLLPDCRRQLDFKQLRTFSPPWFQSYIVVIHNLCHFALACFYLNPFQSNVTFLYPLKTS